VDGATIGNGTVVQDHGDVAVVANDSRDIVVGFRPGQSASGVTLRRNGTGVQFVDCRDSRVRGDASQSAAATLLERCGTPSGPALRVIGGADCGVGPGVTIDAQQAAGLGIQLDSAAQRVLIEGTHVRGQRSLGMSVQNCTDIVLRGNTVSGANAASGPGLHCLDCTNVTLLGNTVLGHNGDGVTIDSCRDVLVGAGNRVVDNGGDGCLAQNSRNLSPVPRVTIESVMVVGRQNGSQSGFRAVNVDARLSNVTATRCAFGLLLQGGSTNATIVNSIFHGNTTDRANSSGRTAPMNFSLYGTSNGSAWSGADNLVNTATNYPRFVNAAAGDLRLQAGSPAIDTGVHATPSGLALPAVDAEGEPRVRGNRVDRGASEFDPSGSSGNSLDLVGEWRRARTAQVLAFDLDASSAHANRPYYLLLSGAGTGPGVALPGGTLPLLIDQWTMVFLGAPSLSTGLLDGQGRASHILPLPEPVVLLLPPRLTFAFVVGPASAFVSNPVIVDFQW
jgi:hypothetical protein